MYFYRTKFIIIILTTSLFTSVTIASGIDDSEVWGAFEFNFNHPGARALGMGGSFVGLADDATAAVSNPAGLTALREPEFSMELKHTELDNEIPFTSNTVAEGESGIFNPGDAPVDLSSISFLNYSKNIPWGNVSVYYREVINYELKYETGQTFYPSRAAPDGSSFIRPLDIDTDVKTQAIGLAFAYPLRDNFSIGANIEVMRGDFDVSNAIPSANFARVIDDEDEAIGGSIGALWSVNEKWALGATYRYGPEFEMDQRGINIATGRDAIDRSEFSFDIPDLISVGAAFKPNDNFSFVVDIRRILYSQITDGIRLNQNFANLRSSDYEIEDGTEIHFGGEYTFFIKDKPAYVRLGYFREPDHRIKYTPNQATIDRVNSVPTQSFDIGQSTRFPGGGERDNFTFGIGIVAKQGFQIDFATSQADDKSEYILSLVKQL